MQKRTKCERVASAGPCTDRVALWILNSVYFIQLPRSAAPRGQAATAGTAPPPTRGVATASERFAQIALKGVISSLDGQTRLEVGWSILLQDPLTQVN